MGRVRLHPHRPRPRRRLERSPPGTRPVPAALPALRVGLLVTDPILGSPAAAECAAGVEAIGAALAALGHHVDSAHPARLEGFIRVAFRALGGLGRNRARQGAWIESRIGRPLRPGDLSESASEQIEAGRRAPPPDPDAQVALADSVSAIETWWDDRDVLVTPAMRQPLWAHGEPEGPHAGAFPWPFSFTGQPVLSVPAHATADGLPIGVQVVARRGHDETLLRLAHDLEDRLGWAHRFPW